MHPFQPVKQIPRHIWEGITQTLSKPQRVSDKIKRVAETLGTSKRVEDLLSETALSLLTQGEGNVIVTVEPLDEEHAQLTIFRRQDESLSTTSFTISLPRHPSGIPLQDILASAVARRLLTKDDRVILTMSGRIIHGVPSALIIVNIQDVFFQLHVQQLATHSPVEVVENTLRVAREIALEGREGKHVGATFLLGPKEKIQPYLRQIILNPFMHYPPEERNITREDVWETVKNFAQLDGAFLIDTDGTIITAGAMITLPPGFEPVVLPGFGTRHTSAASLTKAVPEALAIVVSSSGGTIRIFKEGRIVARFS